MTAFRRGTRTVRKPTRSLARGARAATAARREISRRLSAVLAGARAELTGPVRPSAAPPHSSGLAAARLVGRTSESAVEGLIAVRGWAGQAEHRLSRSLRGPMLAVAAGARATVRAAERVVTPARAVGVVVLAAAIALIASQFVDYKGVEIGSGLYKGVESIAPAPQTDRATAGSAHLYVLIPCAVLAVAALAFAARGRWQAGRAVSLAGAAGIAVSLLVDLPKGLDEGATALGFEGAQARLVEGFWVQLAASAVLLVCGVLLAAYVRRARA